MPSSTRPPPETIVPYLDSKSVRTFIAPGRTSRAITEMRKSTSSARALLGGQNETLVPPSKERRTRKKLGIQGHNNKHSSVVLSNTEIRSRDDSTSRDEDRGLPIGRWLPCVRTEPPLSWLDQDYSVEPEINTEKVEVGTPHISQTRLGQDYNVEQEVKTEKVEL